ncbi:hypothetical protein EWB00_001462, partial [Schistosoma japonicum]
MAAATQTPKTTALLETDHAASEALWPWSGQCKAGWDSDVFTVKLFIPNAHVHPALPPVVSLWVKPTYSYLCPETSKPGQARSNHGGRKHQHAATSCFQPPPNFFTHQEHHIKR